jgi:hypothetical protein
MTIGTNQTIVASDILAIQTTANAALTGTPAQHNVLLGEGGINVGGVAPGAAGQALISNGPSADPAFRSIQHSDISDWASATAGFGAGSTGVTSVVGASGVVTATQIWAALVANLGTTLPSTPGVVWLNGPNLALS